MEGPPLLPSSLTVEGLHPNPAGMEALASNLNAQMGFSPLLVTVEECSPLRLRLKGLSTNGRFSIYFGKAGAQSPTDPATLVRARDTYECEGKALMLTPSGRHRAVADATGAADVTLGEVGSCDGLLVEVVDAGSCQNSRLVAAHLCVGHGPLDGTAAGLLQKNFKLRGMPPPPLLPPPPLPQSPESPPPPPLSPPYCTPTPHCTPPLAVPHTLPPPLDWMPSEQAFADVFDSVSALSQPLVLEVTASVEEGMRLGERPLEQAQESSNCSHGMSVEIVARGRGGDGGGGEASDAFEVRVALRGESSAGPSLRAPLRLDFGHHVTIAKIRNAELLLLGALPSGEAHSVLFSGTSVALMPLEGVKDVLLLGSTYNHSALIAPPALVCAPATFFASLAFFIGVALDAARSLYSSAAPSSRVLLFALALSFVVLGGVLPCFLCVCVMAQFARCYGKERAICTISEKYRESCQVVLELEDGRSCVVGMRQLRGLTYRQLTSALAAAYRRKYRLEVALPIAISFVNAHGEWDSIDSHTWSQHRGSLAMVRVLASTAKMYRPNHQHLYIPVGC